MDCIYFIVTLFLSISDSVAIGNDEVCCAPRFIDSMRSCPDFENNIFNADDLTMGVTDGVLSREGLLLSGSLNLLKDIDENYEIELSVYKLTDMGKEYVYGAAVSMCVGLKSDDAPWSPLVKSLNLTDCPIKQDVYPVQGDVLVNLDFAKDAMDHDFCGEYEVEMSILKAVEKVSCHIMSLEIYEKSNK